MLQYHTYITFQTVQNCTCLQEPQQKISDCSKSSGFLHVCTAVLVHRLHYQDKANWRCRCYFADSRIIGPWFSRIARDIRKQALRCLRSLRLQQTASLCCKTGYLSDQHQEDKLTIVICIRPTYIHVTAKTSLCVRKESRQLTGCFISRFCAMCNWLSVIATSLQTHVTLSRSR